MRISADSLPRPMPENEWIVDPPMLQAAIPVDAVTATASERPLNLTLRALMISRKRTDFPVPESGSNGSAPERSGRDRGGTRRLTSGTGEEDVPAIVDDHLKNHLLFGTEDDLLPDVQRLVRGAGLGRA